MGDLDLELLVDEMASLRDALCDVNGVIVRDGRLVGVRSEVARALLVSTLAETRRALVRAAGIKEG